MEDFFGKVLVVMPVQVAIFLGMTAHGIKGESLKIWVSMFLAALSMMMGFWLLDIID